MLATITLHIAYITLSQFEIEAGSVKDCFAK